MKIRILQDLQDYLTEEFMSGENPTAIQNPKFEVLGDGEEPDYEAIREGVIQLIDFDYEGQKTRFDPLVGGLLHSLLPLSRREASDGLFWAYLSTQIPEFVQWRWGGTSARWGKNWRRNAFSWCWWLVELYDGEQPVYPTNHHSRMHLWIIDTPASSPDILRQEVIAGIPEGAKARYSDPIWMKIRAKLATTIPIPFSEEEQREMASDWIGEFREDL